VTSRALAAKAPSRFPASRRDVALLVRRDVPAGEILDRLRAAAGPLCESVTLFDRYAGAELPEGTHSLAFALTFRADDRTLLDAEVDALIDAVTRSARDAFGAAQR
jgi:phenylalanyl-tRNA synthetase beta chain